jgi:hypothetical protein
VFDLNAVSFRVRSGTESAKPPFDRQFIAQTSGAFDCAKAVTGNNDAFDAHRWRGKQLTSTGKLVTTDKLLARSVLR